MASYVGSVFTGRIVNATANTTIMMIVGITTRFDFSPFPSPFPFETIRQSMIYELHVKFLTLDYQQDVISVASGEPVVLEYNMFKN
jgi:hypothetical protein